MPPELLAAMLQAEQSEPSVRTAALLRIARVLAKADQGEAERLLDRGLALLQLFRVHWRLLPEDEARDAVRSLVGIMREQPDERLNGGFGGPHGRVTFSSHRPRCSSRCSGR